MVLFQALVQAGYALLSSHQPHQPLGGGGLHHAHHSQGPGLPALVCHCGLRLWGHGLQVMAAGRPCWGEFMFCCKKSKVTARSLPHSKLFRYAALTESR